MSDILEAEAVAVDSVDSIQPQLIPEGRTMQPPHYIRDVFKKSTCLYTKHQVEAALDKMSTEISYALADADPVFLCVVVGGMIPMGNLLPRLDFPLEVDYVHATRYESGTEGREIHWKAGPTRSVKDRVVVVVDDILDGGVTLTKVVDYCKEQGAKAVHTAVLVDKIRVREPGGHEKADFCGLTVDDHYVFGYGLDYKEYLRNAPGIYAVADEHK